MSECPEQQSVDVEYYLHVSLDGVSGEQEWGPFVSRSSAEDVVASLGTRANVSKVRIAKRLVV